MKPSLRKPLGVLLFLAILALYCWLASTALGALNTRPLWLQLPAYLLAGIVWLLPMRRFLIWMETGRWQ